ncbi:MAG: helix-turn-helix domain-containing protein [Acetobacterium sp.]|uniref:helix-turn-helix domain-containing protein n=1 Tax=Acetobacterium sp. TaxID=1872094 RepID=UPI0032426579
MYHKVTLKVTGGGEMILVNELKGRIIANGLTQAQMADILGITPKTFHLKMKKGVFDSDEIEQMISILKIENPVEIFFAKKVT